MFTQDHVRLCLKHFVSEANKKSPNRYKYIEDDYWFSIVCNGLFVPSVVISRIPDYLLCHLSIASHGDQIYLRFEKSAFPLS